MAQGFPGTALPVTGRDERPPMGRMLVCLIQRIGAPPPAPPRESGRTEGKSTVHHCEAPKRGPGHTASKAGARKKRKDALPQAEADERTAFSRGRVALQSGERFVYNEDRFGCDGFDRLAKVCYDNANIDTNPRVSSYNGVDIEYDAIDNPLNDGTWTYTWEQGRKLKQMSKSGTTVAFEYDHNDLRTKKTATVNGVTTTTEYKLHGKLVTDLIQGNNKLHFYYDSASAPAMVDYNGVIYTYVKNLQGDVVGIVNNAGTLVVEYMYDA